MEVVFFFFVMAKHQIFLILMLLGRTWAPILPSLGAQHRGTHS